MKCVKMLLSSLALAILVACTTVIPKTAGAKKPSMDQNVANSGIITNMPDGNILVTGHLHDRNEAMRSVYGSHFSPPLAFDYGWKPFTNGTWLVTKEGMQKFNRMNFWRINRVH